MATTFLRDARLVARRYFATRRVVRVYGELRQLVDQLAERADCPKHATNFRTKVLRLRDTRFIGEKVSQRLNRLSRMARKAGTGELTTGELKDLVNSAVNLRRVMVSTERDTRRLIPLGQLADRLGVSADWVKQNWIDREVDPLPSLQWCDGRFINVDTFRDWRAAQPIGVADVVNETAE